MRIAFVLLLVGCGSRLVPCDGEPLPSSDPQPPHTEVWVRDQTTGIVEAELSDGFGFPDATIVYRIIGKRPHGSYQLLFEGELEHWDRRHGLIPQPDGTTQIIVWDRACMPDRADGFTCTAIDPVARWE